MSYPTDLSDPQWAVFATFIPLPKTGGRPCQTSLRAVANAVLYKVNNGCKWRALPHCFPPWQTVYGYYRDWRKAGVWRKMNHALARLVRMSEGRKPRPTTVIIDSQSVKTGKVVSIDSRGIDGGKRVKGRKRTAMVDCLGLLVDVKVTRANVHDTKAAMKLVRRVKKRKRLARSIKLVRVDQGFRGQKLKKFLKRTLGAMIEIGSNPGREAKRFVATARWMVERTFAWLYDNRALIVDQERRLVNSRTMVYVASIRLMLNRLWPLTNKEW